MRELQPHANIVAINDRWQNRPEPLRETDLIYGCLDGFKERRELEALSRRYLIPMIDIGLGVTVIEI